MTAADLRTTRARPAWRRLYSTRPIALAAILVGWAGIYAAYRDNSIGLVLAVLTTVLTFTALHRGRVLAERQRARLNAALEQAAQRNRELERLRHLAGALLRDADVGELHHEVARTAADLLEADSASVNLVVEEGRFLRVVAATGPLAVAEGILVPMDASLVGWVVTHDEPVVSDDQDADPRAHHISHLGITLRSAAVVPLRSAGLVIGTVSVYNRRDGRPFGAHDLQLLGTLGDQVVVGLDRVAVLAESRRNEHALAAKNQELVRATRLKSEFLANMSHELRTPLNAIIGFSDLMLAGGAGDLNETQRDFLDSVLRNGRHLLGLINSVLDLSKIEAGRMTLSLGSTEVRDVINGAITDTASLRQEKEQQCVIQMEQDDSLQVLADGLRIRQILYNLLSNASKFTPKGGQITVAAIRARAPLPVPNDRAGDAQQRFLSREAVWVAVTDTGIGIRSSDMEKLFQEFSQVDSAFNRQQQGTGLGLALCKSFVELHGGTIGAESVFGRGSSFWFLLPVEGPVRRGVAGADLAVAAAP